MADEEAAKRVLEGFFPQSASQDELVRGKCYKEEIAEALKLAGRLRHGGVNFAEVAEAHSAKGKNASKQVVRRSGRLPPSEEGGRWR